MKNRDVEDMYEGYWSAKQGLEGFGDYERNLVIKKILTEGTGEVLDLAAGEGAVSEFIQNLGYEVTAFDISKEALGKASKRGLKTVLGSVEDKLPFRDGQFDVIFWGDNVEHLFMPKKTLTEIYRVLKDHGKLILSCPNMGYWRYRSHYLFNGMIAQTEWSGYPEWEWEHIRFFNKKIMAEFLKSGKFDLKSFFGVSSRKIDKLFVNFMPDLFGMIMVIVAEKNVVKD